MKLGEKMAGGKMAGGKQPISGGKWRGENSGEKTAGEKWLGGNGCKGIKSKVKGYKKEQELPYS